MSDRAPGPCACDHEPEPADEPEPDKLGAGQSERSRSNGWPTQLRTEDLDLEVQSFRAGEGDFEGLCLPYSYARRTWSEGHDVTHRRQVGHHIRAVGSC